MIRQSNQKELTAEFDRQVENLLQKGYAQHATTTKADFMNHLMPLKEQLHQMTTSGQQSRIPFLIVVKQALVSAATAMSFIEVKGQQGHVNMTPLTPGDFSPIDALQIPEQPLYLIADIDTGQDTLNVTPHEALQTLHQKHRSPLTIDEGIALVTHFPEVLTDKQRYNCFSMPGSRRNDQRVPALWMSYKKPRLGWCWDNNPHTWLGTASCAQRIAL